MVAIVLALLCPGFGQMYNGQFSKGLAILLGLLVSNVLAFFLLVGLGSVAPPAVGATVLLVLMAAGLVAVSAVFADAVMVATRICRGEPVQGWRWF